MLKYFEETTPESCGVSSEDIIDFVNSLADSRENQETHAFMLLRHGKVLSKGWFNPYTPETEHTMFSCSKAFTAIAIGFAEEEGLLSIDDYVSDFFPELIPEDADERILNIKIKHLLTMTTGQKGEVIHQGGDHDSDDWAYAFFRRKVDIESGTRFRYDSYASYMLSATIQKLTGLNLIEYLTPRLFEPLDIPVPYHIKDKFGVCIGWSGLRLTLEDFAKIGQLFLNGGKWNGKQIVPAAFCEEAVKKHIDNNESTGEDWKQGYCYQFWRGRHNTYRFCGAFGQMCVVMPDLDAVFAVQSGYDNGEIHTILDKFYDKLMLKFSDKKLVENPEKYAELSVLTANLKLKETFSDIENVPSELPLENKFGYEKIQLDLEEDKLNVKIIGENSFEFAAGLKKSIMSDIMKTDFTCLEVGDNAPLYAHAYKENDVIRIVARFIGTPCILRIDVSEKVAVLNAVRGK